MSENDDFIKIFMHFNAKTAQKHIEFYMNNNYTIFRTFKEDGSCIEKSWVFWKHGKENEHRKPLILQGARQVGKTYSILEFGRIHYENVAYFNFETNPKLNETFEEKISPDYLIPILSHIAGQTNCKRKNIDCI